VPPLERRDRLRVERGERRDVGVTRADTLDIMATLVEVYEKAARALPPADPRALLAFKLRELGWSYRLVRLCEADPPEVVTEFKGEWAPETRRVRIATNFQMLRLKRPETLIFRADHRVGSGAWIEGPTCSIDVVQLQLTDEQRAALITEMQRLGLPGVSTRP
jgi:hypothetical protein